MHLDGGEKRVEVQSDSIFGEKEKKEKKRKAFCKCRCLCANCTPDYSAYVVHLSVLRTGPRSGEFGRTSNLTKTPLLNFFGCEFWFVRLGGESALRTWYGAFGRDNGCKKENSCVLVHRTKKKEN